MGKLTLKQEREREGESRGKCSIMGGMRENFVQVEKQHRFV